MEESSNNDPKKPPAKTPPPQESAPAQTQAERDAESKRRAAAGSARAPAATPGAVSESRPANAGKGSEPGTGRVGGAPTDRSAAALASRQAVERNMEDRDTLAKTRAAARDGPATVAGVVSSRPEPTLPPARVETSASVEAPPTARRPGASQVADPEEVETNRKIPARTSVDEPPAPAASVVMASANHAVPPVASLNHLEGAAVVFAGAEAVDDDRPDVEKGFDESYNDKEGAEVSHEAVVAPVTVVSEDEAMEEAPVYPGVDASIVDNVVADGIEAFVADTVVDATGVAVVMSEEEEEQFEQKRRKKYLCYGAIVLVVVAIAIVVPVVILVGDDGDTVVVEPPPSIAPSEPPSAMPSSAPTSNVFREFLNYLTTLSTSPKDLGTDLSAPQYRAAKWLVDEDTYNESSSLSIEDPKTLQRYALATLYFATGGNNWRLCGEKSASCGDTTWLTATDECDWFSLICEEGIITQISFRKLQIVMQRYWIPWLCLIHNCTLVSQCSCDGQRSNWGIAS
jgi:hypothetical protein